MHKAKGFCTYIALNTASKCKAHSSFAALCSYSSQIKDMYLHRISVIVFYQYSSLTFYIELRIVWWEPGHHSSGRKLRITFDYWTEIYSQQKNYRVMRSNDRNHCKKLFGYTKGSNLSPNTMQPIEFSSSAAYYLKCSWNIFLLVNIGSYFDVQT